MSVLSSKDSFKRIDLDAIILDGSSDSNISLSGQSGTAPVYVQVPYGGGATTSVSTDMVTWSTNSNAFAGYENSMFNPPVRVNDGLFLVTSSAGWFVSTDAYTWNTQSVPMSVAMSQYGSGLGYDYRSPNIITTNNKYVAFPLLSNTGVYSTDSITWSNFTMPINISNVVYGNKKYVIQDGSGSTYISTDLSTWTSAGSTTTVTQGLLKYENGMYIKFGAGSRYYEYSTDAVAWTLGTLPSNMYNSYSDLTYGNGIYLVNPGFSYESTYKSTDLITWTTAAPTAPNTSAQNLKFINNKFYLIDPNSLSNLYLSTDGTTWSSGSLTQLSGGTGFLSETGGYTNSSLAITSAGIDTTESITAGKFIGDASLLTGIPTPNLSSYVTISGQETIYNKTIIGGGISGSTLFNPAINDMNNTSGQPNDVLFTNGFGQVYWGTPQITLGSTPVSLNGSISDISGITINSSTIMNSNSGKIPASYIVRVNQDTTLSNNTNYQNIFNSGNNQITLAPDTLYHFKAVIYAEKTATASNAALAGKLDFNGTAPQSAFLTSIGYGAGTYGSNWTTGSQVTGVAQLSGSQITAISMSASGTTASTPTVGIWQGWIKTNSSNSTTLTFNIQQSATGSSTGPIIRAHSSVIIEPMTGIASSSTLVSGPWS